MRSFVGLGFGLLTLGCSGALTDAPMKPLLLTRSGQLGEAWLVFPGDVCEVALSPDDKLLAVGAIDAATQVLDVVSGKPAYPLDPTIRDTCAMAWSPDGTRLALGGNGGVWLIDGATGKLLGGKPYGRAFRSLAWSADGASFAAGSSQYDGLMIADGNTGTVLWNERLDEPDFQGVDIDDVAWSLDGKTLYLAGAVDVRRFDVATHKLLAPLTGPTDATTTVLTTPDGSLWAGGLEGTFFTWDANGKRAAVPAGLWLGRLRGDSSNGLVFTVRNASVGAWDVGAAGPKWTAPLPWAYKVTVGSARVAAAARQRVELYDRATGTPAPRPDGHTARVTGLAWTAAGVASSGADERLLRWDPATKAATASAIPGLVAVGADGAKVAVIDDDGNLSWGAPGAVTKVAGDHFQPLLSISADGKRLAVVERQGPTHVFDDSGVDVLQIPAPEFEVTALAFSPDHTHLAIGDVMGGVCIVDAALGTNTDAPTVDGPISALAFDPTGTILMMSGAGTTHAITIDAGARYRVRGIDEGLALGEVRGLDEGMTIGALAWSPDGHSVAVGRADGTIGLWSLAGDGPGSGQER